MRTQTVTQTELDNLYKALLAADADIRDIVVFGSSVYAGEAFRRWRNRVEQFASDLEQAASGS